RTPCPNMDAQGAHRLDSHADRELVHLDTDGDEVLFGPGRMLLNRPPQCRLPGVDAVPRAVLAAHFATSGDDEKQLVDCRRVATYHSASGHPQHGDAHALGPYDC